MKVIVQIPCFNEEATLPQTLADIPRQIEGVDTVEILVIDDGSSDATVEVARRLGVEHVVRHRTNRGLAATFTTGLEACLALEADIIVNTDGDNQYAGADIPKLVQPILEGRADLVVGDRQTNQIAHFSPTKKRLQRLGSFVVRQVSQTDVADAVSGFRALSRDAAQQINILSTFSYTIEMLIQAGSKKLSIVSVPVGVNPQTRKSRLYKNIPGFIKRSASTMARSYAMYQPLKIFVYIAGLLTAVGLLPILRFLWFYASGDGGGNIQSLVLGGVLVMMGTMAFLIGLVADLIAFNRLLLERILERLHKLEDRSSGEADG